MSTIKQVKQSYLHLNSWAGHHKYFVTVVGETPKRFRIRIEHEGGVTLPTRHCNKGDIVLVPKYSISDK